MDDRSERTGPTALDREIESMLAVEPSPEFLARVRTRVAGEPEPGGWRVSWMFAAAAAVAAVVVALIAWAPPEATPSSHALIEPARIPEAGPALATAPAASPQPARTRVSAVAAGLPRDRVFEIDLPEVIVAENESTTFAALVANVRQSRFSVAVPAAPDPDAPLEIKELPPVEPLEIEPLVRVAVRQTEGEQP